MGGQILSFYVYTKYIYIYIYYIYAGAKIMISCLSYSPLHMTLLALCVYKVPGQMPSHIHTYLDRNHDTQLSFTSSVAIYIHLATAYNYTSKLLLL